ncbi:hypothetical protein Tsubulata_946382 [Turnera subulata]|uniref:Trichome birefringence-like C-terminal domain-containing protein n=1 Tax=Turnera subulata TaxID=218843 RepID=A0A9Q0EYD2_9ROSI|nr:hypothetical protein Tsubulata_946382 [Turnera subulata]
MMQRWTRRRSHFQLLAFILLGVIVLTTILHNESSIQLIHEDPPSHVPHRYKTPITYIKPNLASHSAESLDRFSRCNSTREYSGKRIGWGDDPRQEESGNRRRESLERCDVFSGKWSVIPADKRSMSPNAHLTIFRAEEYNATVEFLWAPLLVDSNSDDPVNHRLDQRIIRPDSVLRHSSKWDHADILVFNTYLWWRQGPVKLSWSSEQNGACEEIDGLGGMELAMGAWADWVAKANSLNKKIFFVTMSREWANGSNGNCYSEKVPIDLDGYWGSGSDLPTMRMVDRVIAKLGSKVSVLNITQLSEYRKDGHPSIYRKFWETLRPEQLSNPKTYSDCIHWCLPGVPDVWNELLFHFL